MFAQQSNIKVNITGFSSNKGKVMLALYDSEANFLNKHLIGKQASITNKSANVTLTNVPNGIYAISVFHDSNNNHELDTNFMGIPKEDYGCSNNAKGFFGPPKWRDAKFKLSTNKTIHIQL